MSDKRRVLLTLAVAFLFGVLTLGIEFLHTEDSIGGQRECPACQFQHSSLSVSPGALVSLPPLVSRDIFLPVEIPAAGETVVSSRSSRAPPQA